MVMTKGTKRWTLNLVGLFFAVMVGGLWLADEARADRPLDQEVAYLRQEKAELKSLQHEVERKQESYDKSEGRFRNALTDFSGKDRAHKDNDGKHAAVARAAAAVNAAAENANSWHKSLQGSYDKFADKKIAVGLKVADDIARINRAIQEAKDKGDDRRVAELTQIKEAFESLGNEIYGMDGRHESHGDRTQDFAPTCNCEKKKGEKKDESGAGVFESLDTTKRGALALLEPKTTTPTAVLAGRDMGVATGIIAVDSGPKTQDRSSSSSYEYED